MLVQGWDNVQLSVPSVKRVMYQQWTNWDKSIYTAYMLVQKYFMDYINTGVQVDANTHHLLC